MEPDEGLFYVPAQAITVQLHCRTRPGQLALPLWDAGMNAPPAQLGAEEPLVVGLIRDNFARPGLGSSAALRHGDRRQGAFSQGDLGDVRGFYQQAQGQSPVGDQHQFRAFAPASATDFGAAVKSCDA
jgi:hypothetical protein